jgi:hypothetical protein
MTIARLIWGLNIALLASIIIRLWRRVGHGYTGFWAFAVVNCLTSAALLSLAFLVPATAIGYASWTAGWVLVELCVNIPAVWTGIEAGRNIQKVSHAPSPVLIWGGIACSLVTAGLWYFAGYSQHYDSSLEPAINITVTIDFFLFLFMLVTMVGGEKVGFRKTLEFKHSGMLAFYFGINTVLLYCVGKEMGDAAHNFVSSSALSYASLVACTISLVGWLVIFGRRRANS